MGGLGSGRRTTAHLTTECLALDLTRFLKRGFLMGDKLVTGGSLAFTEEKQRFALRWEEKEKPTEKHSLYFLIERYADDEQAGMFRQGDAAGHVTLMYRVKRGDE